MQGKYPIFFIALSFLTGILSFYFKGFSLFLLIPALLMSLGKISRKETLFLLAFFFLGRGYTYAYNFFTDNGRSQTIKIISGKKVSVQGMVTRKVSKRSYFVEVDTLILLQKKFPTDLRVYVKGSDNLNAGDYIKFSGKIKAISDMQEGFRYYLASRNVQGIFLNINHLKTIKFQGNLLNKLRRKLETRVLNLSINRFSKGLLLALLTGNKGELLQEDKELFARSGTSHLLAVSGLHIGILLSFVMLLLHVGYYISLNKKYIYGLSIILIWGFAFFTGGSASVLRASVMTSLFLLGKIFARKTSIFNVIGTAMYLLLLGRPSFVLDIGFQMSFAAVLGIVILFPLLQKCFSIKSKYPVMKYLYDSTLVSLSAQLAVLPLSLYWFGSFPVYFLLANITAVPLIFLIFYTGLFYVLLGGTLLQTSYEFLVSILEKYLQFIVELPNSVLLISPRNIWVLCISATGLVCLGLGIYFFNKRYRKERKIYWELL